MVLGAAVIEEDSAAEQGRRSNGQFFHPPLERTRFTIIHLSDTGHEPRSQTTVPFPSVAPLAPRTLDRVLILGGGGILGPSVVEELGDSGDPDKLPFNLRVTDVHADKRNPGSQPLQLPESHEYVEIDIASNDEVIAAVSVSSDSQLPKASRQGPNISFPLAGLYLRWLGAGGRNRCSRQPLCHAIGPQTRFRRQYKRRVQRNYGGSGGEARPLYQYGSSLYCCRDTV